MYPPTGYLKELATQPKGGLGKQDSRHHLEFERDEYVSQPQRVFRRNSPGTRLHGRIENPRPHRPPDRS